MLVGNGRIRPFLLAGIHPFLVAEIHPFYFTANRKWIQRYKLLGTEGLKDQSKCPKSIPNKKVGSREEKWILELRTSRELGARRIQSELIRHYNLHLSLATIHRILKKNNLSIISRKVLRRKTKKRYNRPIPGEIVLFLVQ